MRKLLIGAALAALSFVPVAPSTVEAAPASVPAPSRVCIPPCNPVWGDPGAENDGVWHTRWHFAHDGVGIQQCHCMFQIWVKLKNLDTGAIEFRFGNNTAEGDGWTRKDEHDEGDCHVTFSTLETCPNSSVAWNSNYWSQAAAPEPNEGNIIVDYQP
jgi:hypothetical protein